MAAVDLYVGAYGGVYPLSFDPARRAWALGQAQLAGRNASYGAYDAQRDVHYLVDEADRGEVAAYRVEGGVWRQLSAAPTQGAAPCFLSADADGAALAAANYDSGSLIVFALDAASGDIAAPLLVRQDHGRGPDSERQDGPHVHCARFAHGGLYWTDLGVDQVLACRYAPGGGFAGEPFVAFTAPPGQGPRHIVFHPSLPRAYLLTELGSQVYVLDVAPNGALTAVQALSTLPPGFDGQSLGGHLALAADGRRLRVTNRGHDSLATFNLGAEGRLELVHIAPTGGRSPRHFRLIAELSCVVVAHEDSDSVTVLALERDGSAGPVQATIAVHKPAFIGALG